MIKVEDSILMPLPSFVIAVASHIASSEVNSGSEAGSQRLDASKDGPTKNCTYKLKVTTSTVCIHFPKMLPFHTHALHHAQYNHTCSSICNHDLFYSILVSLLHRTHVLFFEQPTNINILRTPYTS